MEIGYCERSWHKDTLAKAIRKRNGPRLEGNDEHKRASGRFANRPYRHAYYGLK